MPPRRRQKRKPSQVKSLQKDVRKLKMLNKPEFKVVDQLLSATTDTSGEIDDICLVAQGDDDNNRSGNSIRIMSIAMNMDATIHASATNSVVRQILFYAKTVNGSAPVVGDVIANAGGLNVRGHRNLDNRHNIFVLKEWRYTLTSANITGRSFKFYKRLNMLQNYDNTTGTIADLRTGYLGLLTVTNEATNKPSVVTTCRVRFVDV